MRRNDWIILGGLGLLALIILPRKTGEVGANTVAKDIGQYVGSSVAQIAIDIPVGFVQGTSSTAWAAMDKALGRTHVPLDIEKILWFWPK